MKFYYTKCEVCGKKIKLGNYNHKCSKKAITLYRKRLAKLDEYVPEDRTFDDRLIDGFNTVNEFN